MTFTAVPTTVRLTFKTTSPNYAGSFRVFFNYAAGPPSQADMNSLASSAASSWNATLSLITPSVLALTEVFSADLNSDMGYVGHWQGSHPGGDATTFGVPADVCVLVNHQIQRHYRGGKYRTYLPPGHSGHLASARSWDPSFVANVDTQWGAFIASIIGIGPAIGPLNHVGVSYKQGHMEDPKAGVWDPVNIPAPRPGGPHKDPIVGHATSLIPGSQRRRLRPR